jgi:isopenicillin-N N-acyltransferase like protein
MSFTVVRAAGSPRMVGRLYGEAAAGQISEALSFYEQLASVSVDDFAGAARAAGPYMDCARDSCPDLVAEMEGIAEGANADLDALTVLNCFEEVWREVAVEACTTIVAGNFLMHAEQWYAGHSQVTVVQAEPGYGPGFTSPTCSGFLPAVGFNVTGFAQGIDSLTARDDRVGVPRVFVSRAALGATGLEGAIDTAALEGRAGGYAHVLSSSGRSVVVETSAQQVSTLATQVHTNHYLAANPAAGEASAGSRARFSRASDLVSADPPRSVADCAAILSDHDGEPESICVHEDGIAASGTVFGMICDLGRRRMWVSDGSPCAGRWSEFDVV